MQPVEADRGWGPNEKVTCGEDGTSSAVRGQRLEQWAADDGRTEGPAVMANWGRESVELRCGAGGGGCGCRGEGEGAGAAVPPF
jgi:hypothetical protein